MIKIDTVLYAWSSGSVREIVIHQEITCECKVATIISAVKRKLRGSPRGYTGRSHTIGGLEEDWTRSEVEKAVKELQRLQAKCTPILLVRRSKLKKKEKVYYSWSLEMKDFCISGVCFKSTKMTCSDFNSHIKRFINDGEQET